ncbi:MAG TPA: sugar phosphate nucleotidyltransferase [Candidatus Hydrogenedentes bacterium]|nr:sugar phosphate nucleotidyltransferase [Candidatus Hydrogenedentota bacterium]HOS02171.1 sugar phosphate nucleotidyltransferase [Candidatus Hydrogenedentota bacterium]
MQAVIMAAGQSTRTYPLTLTRPKPLLPLLNRPALAHQLDALHGTIDEAILVVGYMREQIEIAFGDDYRGIRLRYVVQEEQKGTGHAILQSAPHIKGPFLAMNGDDLYAATDLRRLAASDDPAALVKHVEDPRLYGIYEADGDGRVKRLVEKPTEVFSTLANVGAYRFDPSVFDVLKRTQPSSRGEIEITCAIQALAEQATFRVVEMESHWLPIGYPWHLLDANEYLLNAWLEHRIEGEVSPAAHISGRVNIGKGTVVRSGVVIDGPVLIGENCHIGPNCWLRPGATIGNHCKVGHGVEIKNSILMDHAAAPHLNYVGDSIIGERTNLGCGTVTANVRHDGKNISSVVKGEVVDSGRRKLGAIIGDHVHTGINTSIYPGRKFWPHTYSFPGEAVRKDVVDTRRTPQK